jgi:ATP-dependent exoDNAse (exonuclease V) beta subunit
MTLELSQRNAHPRDGQVSLEIETHTYSINGASVGVTSVTTLIGEYFPPFEPDAVIEKCFYKWQKNKSSEYNGKTKDEIKDMWKMSAEEGTQLHAAIEAHYNSHEVIYDQSSKEWGHFQTFQQARQLIPYRTEMMVWSSDHQLAGMIDLLVRNEDGTFSIYDWKRIKRRVYEDEPSYGRSGSGPLCHLPDNKFHRYAMQLSLYRELLERYYDFKVKDMYVVRLHPNASSYELVKVPHMKKEAGGLLHIRKTMVKDDTDLVYVDTDLVEYLKNLAV